MDNAEVWELQKSAFRKFIKNKNWAELLEIGQILKDVMENLADRLDSEKDLDEFNEIMKRSW